jgi:hypothetical protein
MHRKLVGSEVQNQEVAYCCLVGNLGSCRPCVQLSQLTSRRDQVYSCSCATDNPLTGSKNRAFRTARPVPQRGGRGTCMACHCCTTWNLLPNKSNNRDDCEEQERSYNGGGAPRTSAIYVADRVYRNQCVLRVLCFISSANPNACRGRCAAMAHQPSRISTGWRAVIAPGWHVAPWASTVSPSATQTEEASAL